MGDLGLVGGLHLCGVRRASVVPLQRAEYSASQRLISFGLPIPAAAEMIASIVLMYYFLGGEGAPSKHVTLLLVIYGLAGLMVSGFHYFSFKNSDLRKRHPFWILVSAFILITLIIAEPQIMFFTIIPVIYLIGPSLMVFDDGQTPAGEERGDG